MYNKNTKIVCTLGPSSDSVKEIVALIQAGMNVARLNFSHGTYEHHTKIIQNIKKAEKVTGKIVGILQDLQGPKIRLGELPKEGITLKNEEELEMTIKKIIGERKEDKLIIPINYKNLLKDVKKNDIILLNDGLVEIRVVKKKKTSVICKVKFGGLIKTKCGVHLPTSNVSSETITKKDKADLEFGLKHNLDFVAMSFVKNKKDIDQLRDMIEKSGKEVQIIAKIERHEAVKNLTEIIKASDGVMVARGDLGTDIPAEQVPIVQKRIIKLANRYGKPVITATQVLQSMVKESRATRAEISDAANAVFDHTDAIMLSNESAVGKYAVKATTTLTKVASTVEKELQKHEELLEHLNSNTYLSNVNATCLNACELASDTKANLLVIYTGHGYTARQIAKHRLYIPMIVITPHEKTARQLTLVWGVNKVFVKKFERKDRLKPEAMIKFLKQNKVVKPNDEVVLVCNASKKESTISTVKV